MNSLSHRRLAKDTTWTTVALGSRLGFQALYYVLLARTLGAHGLGVFASALALVNILSPFSGVGAGSLIVKYVARDRNALGFYFSHAVKAMIVSGALLAAACVALRGPSLGPSVGWRVVILVAVSELIVVRYVETIVQTLQAIDRLDLMAHVQFVTGAVRLVAVLVCLGIDRHPSVVTFSGCYLAAGIVSAILAHAMLAREAGSLSVTTLPGSSLASRLRDGLPFSIGVASKSVYADIDKTMLTRMVSADVTGIYTAAYRLVTTVSIPILAAVMSVNTRLFKRGKDGLGSAVGLARQIMPYLLAYAVLTGGLIYLCAPMLTLVLGESFAPSVAVVRWLAFVPVIQAVHYLLGDTLMGADFQGWRSACQCIVAAVNIVLNLWLIPLMSWKGAVIATFLSEGLLAVLMVFMIFRYIRIESAAQAETSVDCGSDSLMPAIAEVA